ncbi:MAG TPA: type II toxin-antitoxin system VapC family toxin [Trueperaceae bacterium]|nr:type II toxin-antitoxin system VapC family toxin [Trueperaceae bacterium]
MLLPDVNVLIYAHREDSIPEHAKYAAWLTALATGDEPFALSTLVLVGFTRIVTNARIFDPPTTHETAMAFLDELTSRPNARIISPGPNHVRVWQRLCLVSDATGKLVADAQHAAVAVEHGCTLVTVDADFSRFPGLRWHHPLTAK